jgi:hypothetical protein
MIGKHHIEPRRVSELTTACAYRPCPWAALSEVPQSPSVRSRFILVVLPPEVSIELEDPKVR